MESTHISKGLGGGTDGSGGGGGGGGGSTAISYCTATFCC